MRKLLSVSVVYLVGGMILAQNVGDHRTAGFSASRDYLNSDLGDFKPPLGLFETIELTDTVAASSLIVFEDRLLVGEGGMETNYRLYDRATGSVLWTSTFPVEVEALNYVPSYARDIVILGSGTTATVRAVRVSTGATLWEDPTVGEVAGRFPERSGDLALYHGNEKLVAADALSGAPFWSFDLSTAEAPVSVAANRLYFLTETRVLGAIDIGSGTPLWASPEIGGDGANIIATEKYIFVSDVQTGSVKAVHPDTAAVIWAANLEGTIARHPGIALAYDHLYVFLDNIGNDTPGIKALDPDSGDLLWQMSEPVLGPGMQQESECCPEIKYPVIANNVIYFYNTGTERIRAVDAFTGTLLGSIAKDDVRGISAANHPVVGHALFVLLPDRVDVYQALHDIYFAHIANGVLPTGVGFFSTLVALANTGPSPVTGTLHFVGISGTPMPLPVEGAGEVSSLPFVIAPFSSLGIQTLGSGPQLRGWARVEADGPLRGSSIFQYTEDDILFFEAGVGDARATNRASVFASLQGVFSTGVAVSNPGDETANLTIRLLDADGAEVATASQALAPSNQDARFIQEIFPAEAFDDTFFGTLAIESDMAVVLTAIRTQEGFQMSSYPVAQPVR